MKSKNEYQQLFDEAPVAYYEIDSTGVISRVNRAVCSLFGHRRSDFLGQLPSEFVAPELRAATIKRVREKLQGIGAVRRFETTVMHRDGRRIPVEIHQTLIRDENEKIIGLRSALIDLTDRRQMEGQLRASELMQKTVIAAAMDGLIITDHDAHILEMNDAAEFILRCSRQDCLGKLLHEIIIPLEFREKHKEVIERHQAFADNSVNLVDRFEAICTRFDRSRFPAELSFNWAKSGNTVLFATFIRDITVRKRSENKTQRMIHELSAERSRRDQILNQIAGGVLIMDARGKILFSNDWMQLFLKSPLPSPRHIDEDAALEDWANPDGTPSLAKEWPLFRSLRDGESVNAERLTYRLDGHCRKHLQVSSTAIRGKTGRIIAAAMTIFDVSKHWNTENALFITNRRYRQIFDQDVSANIIFNGSFQLTACNEAAVRLFGFPSRSEMLEASNRGLFPSPSDREGFLDVATQEFDRQLRELRLHRRDGSLVVALGTVMGVRDERDNLVEIRGHLTDVTERRKAERKVISLYARLMKIQDQERRTLSRDLHDSTGQNLSALAMTLGRLDSLLPAKPEAAKPLVKESKELVQSCIQDIRTISYSLYPPLLEDLGLAAALRWFVEGFTVRSAIQVELHISENLDRVSTEVENTLYRVVQEALTNVHRHSGSKTAQIGLQRKDSHVILTVADQGIGVLVSKQKAYRTREGIGIASIREQVTAIKGRLQIQSANGFCLKITVPIRNKTNHSALKSRRGTS